MKKIVLAVAVMLFLSTSAVAGIGGIGIDQNSIKREACEAGCKQVHSKCLEKAGDKGVKEAGKKGEKGAKEEKAEKKDIKGGACDAAKDTCINECRKKY